MTCSLGLDNFATITDPAMKFSQGINIIVGELSANRGGRL